LKGVSAELNALFTTEHDVLNPTYLVQGDFNVMMYVDQMNSCPTLMASYEVLYAIDGQDFGVVKTGVIADA